LRNSIGPAIH